MGCTVSVDVHLSLVWTGSGVVQWECNKQPKPDGDVNHQGLGSRSTALQSLRELRCPSSLMPRGLSCMKTTQRLPNAGVRSQGLKQTSPSGLVQRLPQRP